MNDTQRYDHFKILNKHFERYIKTYLEAAKYKGEVRIDVAIFNDVIRHYHRDLKAWTENMGCTPNDHKQKALYAFWIRKLKPVNLSSPLPEIKGDERFWINEIIAIHIALTELDIILSKEVGSSITTSISHDLLYFFRYKSVSPHSLYLIFASLYFS